MKYCNECGKPLEDGAKFCGNCGATIADKEAIKPVEGSEILLV